MTGRRWYLAAVLGVLLVVVAVGALVVVVGGTKTTGPFKCAEYVVSTATPPPGSECAEP